MNDSLHIALLGDGGSIHNRFVMEWLVSRGHRVTFLTDTPIQVPGAVVRSVVPRHGFGFLRHVVAGTRVASYLRRFPPDVVHVQNVAGYGYWGLLARLHPLLVTCWGSDVLRVHKAGLLHELAIVESLRAADLITGDAEHLNQEIRSLASPSAPVEWWQFGVPVDRYRIDASRGNPPIVLSMRRLRPLYHIDTIVRAFAAVSKRVPDARLVVVGDDEDGPSLHRLADELGLAEKITFTGWVSEEELRAWYARASVAVSVPESDSTPVSLLESFASSLPVVLSDLPANREWVEDGENGRLAPVGDVEVTADAIAEILLNPERAREWGRANRRTVELRGDRDSNMLQLEAWYRRLANGR